MASRATHLMPQRFTQAEQADDGDGDGFDREPGQDTTAEWLKPRAARSARRSAPSPTSSRCRSAPRAPGYRAGSFGAGGRDAATRLGHIRTSSVQAGRRSPTEKHAEDEKRDGGAALPQNCSLTDEQRRDQEDHLVAAAHGERAGSEPTEHPWMRRRDGVFARRQSHWPGSVASRESQSPPAARFQSIRKQLPNGLIAQAADLRVSINHFVF